MTKIVRLFLVSVVLAGCGRDPVKSIESELTPYYPPKQTEPLPIEKELGKATLECEDAGQCPKNSGLVVLLNGTKMGQCSGTLVAPDVVLMNSHCVPESLREHGGDCKYSLGFIAAGDTTKRAVCKEILIASKIGDATSEPDYALMRLQKALTEEPAAISVEGIKNDEQVLLHAVDPASEYRIAGVLRNKTCTAAQGSILAPSFTHAYAKVAAFFGKGCRVIGGNSGSGIRNSRGEVVGVISHGRKKDVDPAIGSLLPDALGVGANLACLDLSTIGISPHSECSNRDFAKKDPLAGLGDPVKIRELKQSEVEKIVKGLPAPFLFQIKMGRPTEDAKTGVYLDQGVYLVPVCVKPIHLWENEVRPWESYEGDKKVRRFQLEHVERSILIGLHLDDRLQPSARQLHPGEKVAYDIHFDRSKNPKKFAGIKTWRFLGRELKTELALQTCTDQQLAQPYVLIEYDKSL